MTWLYIPRRRSRKPQDACLFGPLALLGSRRTRPRTHHASPDIELWVSVERDSFAAAILVARMEDALGRRGSGCCPGTTLEPSYGRPWGAASWISSQPGILVSHFSGCGQVTPSVRGSAPSLAACRAHHRRMRAALSSSSRMCPYLRLGFLRGRQRLVCMGLQTCGKPLLRRKSWCAPQARALFILAIREGDALADPARLLWDPVRAAETGRRCCGTGRRRWRNDGCKSRSAAPPDGRSDP